jgi:hypothetical protein
VFAQVLGELERISRELNPLALDGRRAGELFDDAARAERLCGAIKSLLARRVEETRVWRKSGHRSAAHWVAEATGATVGAAARMLETARALEQLPETDAAFRAETDALVARNRRSVQAGRGARDRRQLGAGPGHTAAGERCEIERVGPVPVTTARALLDDASVAVLMRDGDDVTAVSSRKRTIPTKLRRALEARYPTCGVKGCANDQFLEVDHVVPVAEGGRTELANAWRICSHHHQLKTYFDWKVAGEPGNWDLVPP